ncbi:MAG: Asp-tRNA(Asn)/Glu-tRNA(Gln) amidotransferase subunit GatB [Candidatus Yonathbacteria bacterium]|nr:Asp-tRNA(Asn)/Glu-tRNA(Gln) amidotransferase subunit GatB [Candidatus Yonathbacteria bacterium]NTW47474.1 Asp-tRNA(Asn)/Glu-tRNA(Gln) amidotransferase subunit GatB [Candidatus Yonathbacteria bacterium]
MPYRPVIGLEIHAELHTQTKMFCACKNDAEETRPNVNICPVCMAHPGTLPVMNKKAVEHVLRVGTAVGGMLATQFTEFDRKNYFYPDIPKGYQISQYKYPLVSGGILAGVEITRIHLEEDTATSKHNKGDYSLIDYNRAGVPLMELVTEPVIADAETAMRFAKELQLLLRYLGASEANMEKGQMRVEANISVYKEGDDRLSGTKVEVKNLNSFRVVGKAIAHEIERQITVIERGEKVVQETRGWDENKGETFSQRKKESSHDYRYFPDPDLPKLDISEITEFATFVLPELPWQKRERYAREYGIKAEDIESYVTDTILGAYFERIADILEGDTQAVLLASNYITSDIIGLMQVSDGDILSRITPESLASLVGMVAGGEVSSRGAKDILKVMSERGGDPRMIASEHNLFQKSDTEALGVIVDDVIAGNTQAVLEYRAGKIASLQFLIGQGMKASKGSANPSVLKELFEEKLK